MQKLLASTTSLLDDRDTWDNIAFRTRSDQMPPAGTLGPKTEVDATVATITRTLAANPRPTSAPPVFSKGPFTRNWANLRLLMRAHRLGSWRNENNEGQCVEAAIVMEVFKQT